MSEKKSAYVEPLFDLPLNWSWEYTENVCESVRDGTHDTPKYVDDGIPLVTSKNLRPTGLDLENTRNISLEDHAKISQRSNVASGDVLFAMIGTIGFPVVVKSNTNFSIKNVGLFKKNPDIILPQYLKFWLESSLLNDWLKVRLKGTTQKFAPLGLLRTLPTPLPPLNEQKRIVEKLEQLLSELDKGVEALRSAQEKLKNYRRAVLKAAVEGELSKAWREENAGKLEPASVLLDRILLERRNKWEADELAKLQAKGKTPKNDKWKAKYKEPEPVNTENLPELPEGWKYVSIEHLTFSDKTAMKTGPFGTLMGKKDYRTSGIPIVGIENIGDAEFVGDFSKFIELEKFATLAAYEVDTGDILISRSGTVGEICVYPEEKIKAVMSTNLIRVRVNRHAIDPYFFTMLFKGSPFVLQQVDDLCKGSTRSFLNQTILSSLVFPLPPLNEQKIMLEEVDKQLSNADKLRVVSRANTQRSGKLRQAILKKAFSGQLVPQDPNDEPASVLLERIRQQKDSKPTRKKPRKRAGGAS